MAFKLARNRQTNHLTSFGDIDNVSDFMSAVFWIGRRDGQPGKVSLFQGPKGRS
jgi:hypothetical protein